MMFRPRGESFGEYTTNELVLNEHPMLNRAELISTPGKARDTKQLSSDLRIFEQELDRNSKINEFPQLSAIIDGMSKIMMEIKDIRNEIRDMKSNNEK